MTRKWYATLRHPKMYPHTKFGIPTSKNIGDMDRTRKWDGRTDSAITICLPKFLWGHKKPASSKKHEKLPSLRKVNRQFLFKTLQNLQNSLLIIIGHLSGDNLTLKNMTFMIAYQLQHSQRHSKCIHPIISL